MKFVNSIKMQDPGRMIEVYCGTYAETKDRESWLNDTRFTNVPVEKIKDYERDPVVHIKLRLVR